MAPIGLLDLYFNFYFSGRFAKIAAWQSEKVERVYRRCEMARKLLTHCSANPLTLLEEYICRGCLEDRAGKTRFSFLDRETSRCTPAHNKTGNEFSPLLRNCSASEHSTIMSYGQS